MVHQHVLVIHAGVRTLLHGIVDQSTLCSIPCPRGAGCILYIEIDHIIYTSLMRLWIKYSAID